MTLYLKYRSQTIDELDLKSVRDSLTRLVKSGNIPHAFLFSGPKGTGKTSAARILAKIVNCEHLSTKGEPCNKCASCISITNGSNIDVIELDAASNRGIDDIRSLKEGISLSPASAKKKIYIIDEAHMLTLEAANAFLKTLEEPPDHVIFILATTNPEKLPETVISRLTRIDFTKASDEDITRQLNRVAKGEKIHIEPNAIKKIAKLADGSFRDAVKIFEGLSLVTKDIKAKDIVENTNSVSSFFKTLSTFDTKENLEFIENLVRNGVSIKNFTDDLIEEIHKSILAKNAIGEDPLSDFSLGDLIDLVNLITDSKKIISPIHELPLELAIIKFLSESKSTPSVALTEAPPSETKSKNPPIKTGMTKTLDSSLWQKLLQTVREKNVSMEALLRAAEPLNFDGKVLTLGVYYRFHKEHLEDVKNTKILEEFCKETFETDSVKVVYELVDKPRSVNERGKPATEEVDKLLNTKIDKDIIDAAKEIFG